VNPTSDTLKDFYKRMLSLALPVVFQSLLANSLSFVDTLMIGQLGEQAIAAVGLANQMFFLISLLFFGITSGSSIFLAQYWGAKNEGNIKKVMGISLTIAIVGSCIFAIASFAVPNSIMHIFTRVPAVVEYGSSYLRIVAISYIFSAVSQIFSTALRVVGHAKTPLKVAIVSLTINAVGNYLLIFGIGPFPELGVAGAAISTAFSRLVEVIALLVIVYRKHPVLAIREKSAFHWNKRFLNNIVPTCLPVILNEFFWALGMTAYKIAYSKMGINPIAAVNVTESIGNLFFVAMIGVSNATLIMIGVKIGEGKMTLAKIYAKRFILTALGVGIAAGAFEALFASTFASLFNITQQVRQMAIYCLYVNALLLPIKSMNMSIIVGILRSGGDTRYSMFAEMFGVWAVGVPLAFFGSMVLHLDIWNLYLLLGLEEATKLVIGLIRIKKGSWINDLTNVH